MGRQSHQLMRFRLLEQALVRPALTAITLHPVLTPLDGIKILDLTRLMSGPFATLMLADLGADVIKVEQRHVGDIYRGIGGYRRGGTTAIFMGFNRGKRSIAVDLRHPDGQALMRELATTSDVLIENFRPGVLHQLGLSPDSLHALNPGLVIASISGFGPTGPSAQEPAYDTIIQVRSGIASRQKENAEAPPDTVRSFISDKLSGVFAAQSILAALVARGRGVLNQQISVSMLDASMYYAWPDVLQEIAFVGEDVTPGATFGYQRTIATTCDGAIAHAAVSLKDRRSLASAIGRDDLNCDQRFASLDEAMKAENMAAFPEEIAATLKDMTTEEALARIRAADVPVARVAEPVDILHDPHVLATGFVSEVEHPTAGRVRHPSYPSRFSQTATNTARPSPGLGEHTVEVLTEHGIDMDRITDLLERHVVGAQSD
jgi:crotonobetainyl-CoA:carnitine CoA-transferase CaiB-like acyl-CoA transferase